MRVAVDAMGGDYAPKVVVQGAVEAAAKLGVEIILVGHEEAVKREVSGFSDFSHVSIRHCTQTIAMEESPLKAVRHKKEASIRVAFDLVRQGEADAVVSAGNSGATLAAGILALGRLEGVDRPAIASIFPGEKGPVIVIDVGANVDCRPAHLFQFGVMAHAFAGSYLHLNNPSIGLLSIGQEGTKGNEQVRLARDLFEKSDLNFLGNVEGRDIFSGDADIIVCDGFVGNVALKLSEGMAETMIRMFKREVFGSLPGKAAFELLREPLEKLRKRLDYEEYGGAPLLGINGVGIICHGGSTSRAIKNAISLAAGYVERQVLEKMRGELLSFRE